MNTYNRTGTDGRKQAVSIRMSRADVRHIKRLAERLGARDSDVIRFAIKLMLSRLAPLQDPSVRGRGLVPVFLESGPELMRHFELDAASLSGILNDGVEEDRRIDADDVQLIAMSGIQRSYVKLRVEGFRRAQSGEPTMHNGLPFDALASTHNSVRQDMSGDDPLEHTLRQYLYEKYLFTKSPVSAENQGGGT